MSLNPTIVWFRLDLRLEDQPALTAAAHKGGPIIPLYIWAPEEEGNWQPGGATRWWLHGSLNDLQKELEKLGLPLIIRQHSSLQTLLEIAKETKADAVYWNRRYEPFFIQRDAHIKAELRQQGINGQSFNGSLLFEPWTIQNKQGKPFQVFTPFWKNCCQQGEPEPPLDKPKKIIPYPGFIHSDRLEELHLLPTIHWDAGLKETWKPGSSTGKKVLNSVLKRIVSEYSTQRDYPGIKGTSELSPYLHFGDISPRQIWHTTRQLDGMSNKGEAYLRQLGWREFAHHLLYHFPHTPEQALQTKFQAFPWKNNQETLHAWQKGLTGYPIVDAGMRQLWHTGWMHNRVRMIVGSFLVKDLLIPWQEGAKWFWDTLVDADLANNTLGWQWIAGCGADAAPYFRIFNPITQGEKFDSQGEYVRTWIPEIKHLPNEWIHQPWEASPQVLRQAGITLGRDYPNPIVNHKKAREKALAAYSLISGERL